MTSHKGAEGDDGPAPGNRRRARDVRLVQIGDAAHRGVSSRRRGAPPRRRARLAELAAHTGRDARARAGECE